MYATILYGFGPEESEYFASPATCNFWLTTLPKYNKEIRVNYSTSATSNVVQMVRMHDKQYTCVL